MKNVFKKLIVLTIPFLVVGCSQLPSKESVEGEGSSAAASRTGSSRSKSSSSKSSSSSTPHVHDWSTNWEFDETNHWHRCSGCNEKDSLAAHTLGELAPIDKSILRGADQYAYCTNIKARKCTTCDYYTK